MKAISIKGGAWKIIDENGKHVCLFDYRDEKAGQRAKHMAAAERMHAVLCELAKRPNDYLHPDDWEMIFSALSHAKGEE